MTLNPEVPPVWGILIMLEQNWSLMKIPCWFYFLIKNKASIATGLSASYFYYCRDLQQRQRIKCFKASFFPSTCFRLFSEFRRNFCCYLAITFFPQILMLFKELCQKAPSSDSILSMSLSYLPNHYIVLPSWHLLKYFTKHPEDNDPHCDKCSAGWRALMLFHTTASQIHAPMPHNYPQSTPTHILLFRVQFPSPLRLLWTLPAFLTSACSTFIFLLMRLRQKNRQ